MKKVSKFSIGYIVGGTFILILPLFVAFMFCFATSKDNPLFEFDRESITNFAFVAFIVFTIYFLTLGKFVRIICTEDFIILHNLFARRVKIINYYDIKEIKEFVDVNVSSRASGHYSTYSVLQLTLENGKIIILDDYAYDNFTEIVIFILKKFHATKFPTITEKFKEIDNSLFISK